MKPTPQVLTERNTSDHQTTVCVRTDGKALDPKDVGKLIVEDTPQFEISPRLSHQLRKPGCTA